MRCTLFALSLALFSTQVAIARDGVPLAEDRGAAALYQAVRKAQTTASVMHIVAHPDDEDGALLALLARGQGVHTTLLSLTRGEGGANLIAPFFFDQLGVLRTLEFLEAAKYYDVDLIFTRAADYGYSKSVEEALRKWDREEILRDVVAAIRRERPDVLISRFWGGPRDGHGHHTLAGLIAQDAYEAAADPKRFPDQIAAGLQPWAVKKLYRGNINPRWRPADADVWTVAIDTGAYDPLLGASYHQIARRGYGFHRSQGILNHRGAPGERLARYQLLRSRLGEIPRREDSIFDGLDVTLPGLARRWPGASPAVRAQLVKLDKLLRLENVSPLALDAAAPDLISALDLVRQLAGRIPDDGVDSEQLRFLLLRKERQVQRALALSLAIDFEAAAGRDSLSGSSPFSRSSTFAHAVPGQTIDVGMRLVNQSQRELRVERLEVRAPTGWEISVKSTSGDSTAGKAPGGDESSSELNGGGALRQSFSVVVPAAAQPTRRYWRRASIHETMYTLTDSSQLGRPFAPPPVWASARLSFNGTSFELREPVRLVLRDVDLGSRYPPVTVAPRIGVRFATAIAVLPKSLREHTVTVIVQSDAKEPVEGAVRLEVPSGWSATPKTVSFKLEKDGEESAVSFELEAPANREPGDVSVGAVAVASGREYREGYVTITAPDIGRSDEYRDALHTVRTVDVTIAADLRIAYVMGSGDDIPAALAPLGVEVELLSDDDLAENSLDGYDAIVLGVRAYAVRRGVKRSNGRLLAYVERGGVLIVQYQTPEFDDNFGPYTYSMGRAEEVSEEQAVVRILAPENPVFTTPNPIGPADFSGWVEQRGSKFWKEWDPRYVPLLESHDSGQEPQRGGMLWARHGRGVYLYAAYSWYRQLPAGVPGAFRIYANLLSLKRTIARQ